MTKHRLFTVGVVLILLAIAVNTYIGVDNSSTINAKAHQSCLALNHTLDYIRKRAIRLHHPPFKLADLRC